MRHVPDGVLRRLDDEPLAVPDSVSEHLAGCARCDARRAQIAADTERVAASFSTSRPALDADLAWARIQRDLRRGRAAEAGGPAKAITPRRRRPRFPRVSLRAGLVMASVAVLAAGTAAAATLTAIFEPTHVAPVPVSQADVRAIAALAGLSGGNGLGGFSAPLGSSRLRFGTIAWSSAPPRAASSVAQAGAEAGFPVSLPADLPTGVGALRQLVVAPRASARVTFNSTAGSLAGTSVTVHAGPAVAAAYAGAGGSDLPALAVATMRRPTALSSRASLSQIEAFLLSRPGVPPQLAEEVRLLGDLRTALPVPVPAGASVRSVKVRGWPAVLLSDSSNGASGVIWEDGRGMLHVVAGLLDSRDVLGVAAQIG